MHLLKQPLLVDSLLKSLQDKVKLWKDVQEKPDPSSFLVMTELNRQSRGIIILLIQ